MVRKVLKTYNNVSLVAPAAKGVGWPIVVEDAKSRKRKAISLSIDPTSPRHFISTPLIRLI